MTTTVREIMTLIQAWSQREQKALLLALRKQEQQRLADTIDQLQTSPETVDMELIIKEVLTARGIDA